MPEKYSLDISIYCNGMAFQGDTLEHKSLGGSETAALCTARELAKRRHRVTVYSQCEQQGVYDGVKYIHIGNWPELSRFIPCDVAIVQRDPGPLNHPINSKLNLFWVHDLAMRRSQPYIRSPLWNVDKILTVSEYHAKQWQDVYELPEKLFVPTRNGIDLDLFPGFGSLERNRKRLVYAARPERGLDVLLKRIFPRLLERDPELTLAICGYDNTVPEMEQFYRHLREVADRLGDRIEWRGALTKSQLYELYATSGAYVYPTPSPTAPEFREVSCITAMECMAAGLPFVYTAIGALPETCGEHGVPVHVTPDQEGFDEAFCDAVVKTVNTSQASFDTAATLARAHAESLGWDGVAEQWETLIYDMISERNDSPERLARHLLKHGDVVAADAELRGVDSDYAAWLRDFIDQEWGDLLEGGDAAAKHNERIGELQTAENFAGVTEHFRLRFAAKWLMDNVTAEGGKNETPKVLDFGCSYGAYTVHLANITGFHFTGVDHDTVSLGIAREIRDKHLENGDAGFSESITGDGYDAIVAQEVLEHVPEPWVVVDELEKHARKGARVLITVPFGPWEYSSWGKQPREHLWHFDMHDVRDMFMGKKDLATHIKKHAECAELPEPIGWHIIEYTVDGTPTGKINLARKRRLQAPRETVSLNMIVGPNAEETLHWALNALKHVPDEVIIGDTGMSDEARRIIAEHINGWYGVPVSIVDASDPKTAGFETPRNQCLDHSVMDWVLWIDTDEKLLGQRELHKYLRKNMFDGYGIQQHHFAIDTHFSPDMPVRLFRRIGDDGRAMRFFGMVHEHPEKEVNEGPGIVYAPREIGIAHVGYLREDIRRERFARNWPLMKRDEEKYPDRVLQKMLLMRDHSQLAGYILEQNGGRITDEVVEHCKTVIDLWREYFRGKDTFLGSDPLEFYNKAVQILKPRESFEMAWQFAAGKNQASPNGCKTVRFANEDDMKQQLEFEMRKPVEQFRTEWY